MLRRLLILTLVVSCLLFALPAFAQEVQQGEITAEAKFLEYELDLEAGTSLLAVIQGADGLSPLLFVYAPSGGIVAHASTEAGQNSTYLLHQVTESGTYRVRARGADDTVGTFQLLTEPITDAPAALVADTLAYADLPQSRTADGAYVLGDPDAPITVIEFADWVCPHCVDYHPAMDQFILDYVATGQAKFEFRIFPTAGGQLTAVMGALAECADNAQAGTFWQAHALYYHYAETGLYDSLVPFRAIEALNLDFDAMATCLPTAMQWQTDVQFGRDNAISGTPAVLIRYGEGEPEPVVYDGVTYDQGAPAYDVLTAVIEAAQNAPEATAEATTQP